MDEQTAVVQTLVALKGAPASILLAFSVTGGPLTVRRLCLLTGYCDKVVRQALARMRAMGLLINDPELHTWQVNPASRQAAMLLRALRSGDIYSAHAEDSAPRPAGSAGFPSGPGAFSSADAEDSVRRPSAPSRPRSSAPGALSSADAEDISREAEGSAAPAADSSASRAPDLTASSTTSPLDYYAQEIEVEERERTSAGKRPSPGPLSARQKEVRRWLLKGGVGSRSPVLAELLALDLEPRQVMAHVLERLAWEEGLVPEQARYPVGLLVTRLRDGDPPPPMRCPDCLSLKNAHGLCRCELEALIKR